MHLFLDASFQLQGGNYVAPTHSTHLFAGRSPGWFASMGQRWQVQSRSCQPGPLQSKPRWEDRAEAKSSLGLAASCVSVAGSEAQDEDTRLRACRPAGHQLGSCCHKATRPAGLVHTPPPPPASCCCHSPKGGANAFDRRSQGASATSSDGAREELRAFGALFFPLPSPPSPAL